MPNWKKVIVSGSSAHLNQITGSTFLVDGNQSNNFIAVIDNDQNTNGHVLKLASDGTGNGSHILDMENGSNTMFRARADGRFAFGNSAVGSMGAGTFVVGIDGGHTSDIAISKRLQHLGDSDTYIDFESNKIILSAGGNLLDYTTTKFSGSAVTTGSFGRVQASVIGGNSPLRIESDNFNVDSSGNVTAASGTTGSFGRVDATIDVPTTGFIRNRRFRGRSPMSFDTEGTRIEVTGSILASANITGSNISASGNLFGTLQTATQNNITSATSLASVGTVTVGHFQSDVTVGAGKTLNASGGTLTLSTAQKKGIVQDGIAANDANVDFQGFEVRAQTFESDVTTGTAPLTIASTTLVSNLNADKLDGQEGSYYLDFSNFVVDDDEIPIAKLASDSITIGGTSTQLGGSITAATILDSTNVVSGSAQINSLINDTIAATIVAEIDNDEIPIAKLAQDSMTIAGNSVSLGGSVSLAEIIGTQGLVSGSGQIDDLINDTIAATIVAEIDNDEIPIAKLAQDSITIAGVSTSLGGSITQATILDASNVVSGSSIASSAQGQVTLTTNGVAASAVDLGLQAGDSPSFAGLSTTTSGATLKKSGAQADVLTLDSVTSGAGGGGAIRYISTSNSNTLGRISVVDESNYAAGFSFQTNKTGGASDTTTETLRIDKNGNILARLGGYVSASYFRNNVIQVGKTAEGEIDTASGNLTLDSAGGTVTVDDNLSVTGTVTLTNDLAIAQGGTGASTAAAARLNLNDGSGIVSGSSIASSAQGQVALTTNGVAASAVDLGLQSGDSPTFAGGTLGNIKVGVTGDNEIDTSSGNLTLDSAGGTITLDDNVIVSGDFTVSGTTTTIDTTNLNVGDNIVELNAGTSDGGIYVKETSGGNATGSLLFDVSENYWIAGVKDSEVKLVTISGTDTLTNKSINLANNTITGTTANFNSALSDDSFATLTNTVTLTNKTLTSPIISSISNTGTITLPTSTDTLVGRATTDTLTNKTLTSPDINAGTVDSITSLTTGNIAGAVDLKDSGGNTVFTYPAADLGSDAEVEVKIGDVDSATTGTFLSIKPVDETISVGSADLLISSAIRHIGDTDTKMTFTDDNVQFKVGNVNMLTLAESTTDTATFVADTIDIGNAVISGSLTSSGSFGKMVVGGTFANSGSTVLKVQGQQGVLFSIVDEMSGSIFSANTQAGIPVIEAFSDQKVVLGPASNPITINSSGHITSSAATTASFGRLEVNGSTLVVGNQTINQSNAQVLNNTSGTNTGDGQTTFTLAGDGGSSQTISNGNTLTIEGGNGITTTAGATDKVEVAVDTHITSVQSVLNASLKIGASSTDEYIDFGTDAMIKFAIDDVEDFRMADGGTFHANADIIAYSSTVASDRNLKTNIIDTKYGLGDVLKLQGREFDWKREDRGHDVGFIAQEVQEVIPELVKEVDSIGENDGDKHLAVDYAKLVPVLVESIKELKKEIEEIKQNCDCLNK